MTDNMRIWGVICVWAGVLLMSGCASKKEPVAKPAAETIQQTADATKPANKVKKTAGIKPRAILSNEVSSTPHSESPLPTPFIPRMPGKRIAQVNVPGRYVALTFDDGPSAAYTPKVLDILKRHNAKATFFVVGQCAVHNKGIMARAVAEGHEIAAHTWSHIKMTGSSDEKIISEMDRTNAVITEATGRRPKLMRPPYGASNSHVQDLMMSRYGMASILWNVDTQDWRHPGVSVVIDRAVSRANSGSIILLHDIHASTLAAVEGVVTGLQRRGFTLVTVSELIEMGRRAAQQAGLAAAEPSQPASAEQLSAPTAPVPGAATAVTATPAPEPASAPSMEEPAVASEEPSSVPLPASASVQEVASPMQVL